jgi:hypothetical protein
MTPTATSSARQACTNDTLRNTLPPIGFPAQIREPVRPQNFLPRQIAPRPSFDGQTTDLRVSEGLNARQNLQFVQRNNSALTVMLRCTYIVVRCKIDAANLFRPKPPYGAKDMMTNFDEIQKTSKENMDLAMASVAAMSKGVQALALETQDYSKKAMETGSAAMEDLLAAKSLDKAVEVQSDYLKTAYEAFVGQATKVNEMVVDLAKETYKPYEGMFAKVAK